MDAKIKSVKKSIDKKMDSLLKADMKRDKVVEQAEQVVKKKK